jgi:hypothetical protein
MGTVTTEATLDLGPSKLDIAKYRDKFNFVSTIKF